jgi:predicted DNA-binding transcriptional regulator AlpA
VTVDQLKALPPIVSAEVAFAALGVGRSLGYQLIRNGQFPVPALRLGRIIKIPTAPLLELLGVRVDEVGDGP